MHPVAASTRNPRPFGNGIKSNPIIPQIVKTNNSAVKSQLSIILLTFIFFSLNLTTILQPGVEIVWVRVREICFLFLHIFSIFFLGYSCITLLWFFFLCFCLICCVCLLNFLWSSLFQDSCFCLKGWGWFGEK